jgi:2-polyprenyl-3-methyl-5-hydroxy-6-metoxy-1,4-benzoquinol methylase
MTLRWKIAQTFEKWWWQNYLKNKPTTDYAAWKTRYWEQLLSEIGIKPTPQQTIFDAGCGPAGIFMALPMQKVVALDPLLDSYERDLPHFKKSNYPNVEFLAQPLENFNQTEVFDTVFCLNAINHVADLSRCFDTLVSATKRGGTLVVSIDAHNYGVLKKIFQLLPGDILHPHQYDLAEYAAMLTQRGCVVEKTVLKKAEFIFNYYVLVVKRN